MAISSVSSNASVQLPAKVAAAESTEASVGGKDVKKDGDADDAAVAKASTPKPMVNTLGEQLGRNLNVSA